MFTLPDRFWSKIVKKHWVDLDDRRTLVYTDFYITTLKVCKLDNITNRYKENRNPILLSSKVGAVNNILSVLKATKNTTKTAPLAPLVPVPTID